jgi:hypothetical protein
MYTKILSFASVDLQPIMDITQRKLKGANYEILVNSLWLEVAERINKECKSIFAAGQTDIFHKVMKSNYYWIEQSCHLFKSYSKIELFCNCFIYQWFRGFMLLKKVIIIPS